MVRSTKKKSATFLLPRRCKYCRATFVPDRPQDKDAKFCCPNHRKNFWRYGGLPFDKMLVQLERKMRPAMREEMRSIAREEFARLMEKNKC